jgi:CRP-like cAMP-binding protein
VIDENQQNSSLFYVRDGSFGVFVGDTKVATLVRGDWFGEASLLSVFVTRARVVCEKKSSELHVVGGAHLAWCWRRGPIWPPPSSRSWPTSSTFASTWL